MYDSSLIGRQWAARIAAIDKALATESMDYMGDIDDLLEQRKRLTDALFYSGEVPTRP